MSKEFKKALSRYFSLENFKSIVPSTLTLFIVNTLSSERTFVYETNNNMIAVKKIKKYSLKETIK